jgi:hypothetical protein
MFEVHDTSFNKTIFFKGIMRIGGGGDGGPNIVPWLLHGSNLDSKLISQIAKILTVMEFAATMSRKVECRNNPLESVILRSTKQLIGKLDNNNPATKPRRLHAHVDNET